MSLLQTLQSNSNFEPFMRKLTIPNGSLVKVCPNWTLIKLLRSGMIPVASVVKHCNDQPDNCFTISMLDIAYAENFDSQLMKEFQISLATLYKLIDF